MSKKSFLRTKVLGFTLLELLVVISIIGILTAIGAASFSVAQRQGRDAKRKGDIKAAQAMIEQCRASRSSYTDCISGNSGTKTMTVGSALTSPPTNLTIAEPSDQNWYSATANSNYYCLCSRLDGDNGNYGAADCSTVGSDYFCVKNLQ